MAKEIERKFIVKNDSYRDMAHRQDTIIQAYLSKRPEATVRLRIRDNRGFITVKSKNNGPIRNEWEYEIPVHDVENMLEHCQTEGIVINKHRYYVMYDGMEWEVDEFQGALFPLVLTEIELESEDTPIKIPPFVGEEVTHDPRYFNSSLAQIIED